MAPFTPKSTLKLRSALHFRYSIVTSYVIPYNPERNPNNHYYHGFHKTFDHNHFMYSDYLLYTVTASAYIVYVSPYL